MTESGSPISFSSSGRRLSVAVTRAPRAAQSCAAAIPDRPRPTTNTRLSASWNNPTYLTLSVVMRPRIAQAKETIQKRTTIRDSGHPSFSKW